ncbi:LytR C-terminal domain-containing protein [Kineosporiaceae bacterium SCSIO 59966]|nr:LytR C-terminal domain-containing protein [Kineosporiaceae bacterium SCSIO 59966]
MTDPGWGPDGTWTEEDERRYQARRAAERRAARVRRAQTSFFAALVLVVLGAGVTAAGVYQSWWAWPPWGGQDEPGSPVATATSAAACPTPEVTAAPVADVVLVVLNGTRRPGLAAATAEALTARGFTVGSIGNDTSQVEQVALVRHGPEGLLHARTVAAQIEGAELVDDGREGTAVELSLGAGFAGLRPPEEAAELTRPTPVESRAGCVVPTLEAGQTS